MKKIGVVLLASLLALGSVGSFGCGRGDGIKIDKDKTQLYVATFDGGYGRAWLDAVGARFEEAYAGVSFESGKTGVQVLIKADRELTQQSLVNNLSGDLYEVFFTEAVNYYDLQSRGLLYDISEAITKPLNYDFQSGTTVSGQEEVSIQDKMRAVHSEYFQADDGKYYGMPFYEANYGIVYDIDLFESELLYFAAEDEGDEDGFILDEETPRSNGPDGEFGTSDDGLPATYDDFFKLCDTMVSKKITPITWTGATPTYVNTIAEALQADYEGEKNMRVNYTFDGTTVDLIEAINPDGTLELYNESITYENGYLSWTRQPGKYYGLKFIERLTSNENYFSKSDVIGDYYDQVTAQNAFILDKFIPGSKPIAMLVDGSWWHNEAEELFKAATKKYGVKASSENRRFGFMPLPKATPDKVGEPSTVLETNSSICFVNGNLNTKKDKLVKEFIQFCHTNESLEEFTSITYSCKPYEYEMAEEKVNAMPYWGQELYRLHNEAHFISNYSKHPLYKQNAGKFTEYFTAEMFKSIVKINGKDNTVHVVSSTMIKNGISAEEYFNGLAKYMTQKEWEDNFIPTSLKTQA